MPSPVLGWGSVFVFVFVFVFVLTRGRQASLSVSGTVRFVANPENDEQW